MVSYYLVVPWLVLVLSTAIASYVRLTPTIKSVVNHFTAGVILAALATELLPEVSTAHLPVSMSVGFLLGTLAMLGLKWFSESQKEQDQGHWPWGFIAPVAIDLFVDGWLIVLALKISLVSAVILALALGLEMLSLGAAIWMKLRSVQSSVVGCFAMGVCISLFLLLGGLIGQWAMMGLSPSVFVGCLSFGMAALLYLVAEELLVEAHCGMKDSPGITSFLFLGMWFIILFKDLVH